MTQAALAYTPGDWVAIVRPGAWALIQMPSTDPRVRTVWDELAGPPERVLDALLSQGLSSLPGFALLTEQDQGLLCVVREPAEVLIDGERMPAGSGIGTPWEFAAIGSQPERVEMSAPAHPSEPLLPVLSGAVAAGALAIDFSPPGEMPLPRAADNVAADPPAENVAETDSPAAAKISESPPQPARASTADPTSGPVPSGELAASLPAHESAPPTEQAHSARNKSIYHQLLNAHTTDLAKVLAQARAEEAAAHESDVSSGDPGAVTAHPEVPSLTQGSQDDPQEADAPLPPKTGETVAQSAVSVGASDDHDSNPITAQQGQLPPSTSKRDLIDGVPWLTGSSASRPSVGSPRPPQAEFASSTPVTGQTAEQPAGVTRNRAAMLRDLAGGADNGPTVRALRCPRDHFSPPDSRVCRVCGTELPQQDPVQVPRPSLGHLRLSNGLTVPLDRGVIFGREPKSDIADAAKRPNLIRLVESEELSRMHASVTVDEWQVFVQDLGSSNGTTLTAPDGTRTTLPPKENYPFMPGAIVSLADVVTFTYDVTT